MFLSVHKGGGTVPWSLGLDSRGLPPILDLAPDLGLDRGEPNPPPPPPDLGLDRGDPHRTWGWIGGPPPPNRTWGWIERPPSHQTWGWIEGPPPPHNRTWGWIERPPSHQTWGWIEGPPPPPPHTTGTALTVYLWRSRWRSFLWFLICSEVSSNELLLCVGSSSAQSC